MEQLTYRQLSISCDADISQLQAVLEAAPNYYKIIQGKGPSTDEARSELQALPEGHPVAAKFYYLIQDHQHAVSKDVKRPLNTELICPPNLSKGYTS